MNLYYRIPKILSYKLSYKKHDLLLYSIQVPAAQYADHHRF